jgi:flagellar biosynthetic protein FliP
MLGQTREKDMVLFMEMSETPAVDDVADVPLTVLVPAFITSELKTAFTIGFLIYIPFIIIDLVVASVLMSMGMMMLSPMMISMPFKLLLFVLVDGWGLVTGSLVATYIT